MRAGIVYAAGSKIIRRIVIPDDPMELAGHVTQGEALIEIESKDIPSLEECEAAVEQATGTKPPSARCVVIDDKGDVVDVRMLDPELDASAFPDKRLKLHATADREWKYNDATDELSRKAAEVVDVERVR